MLNAEKSRYSSGKAINKLLLVLIIIAAGLMDLQSQVQIYYQNFSDTSGSLPANWSNTGTCGWVSSLTNPSNGYSGASGGRNLYAPFCTGNAVVMVTNISTLNFHTIKVTWGGFRSQPTGVIFEYSGNSGSSWQPVSFQDVPLNVWALTNEIQVNFNNHPNVWFRWRITDPIHYRIDDFKVTGTYIVTPPTKLVITAINGSQCARPQTGIPFNVTVQSRDANNQPANVTSTTGIFLSSSMGLTGNLYGVITQNTNSVTINNVFSNASGTITITASTLPNSPPGGMNLLPFTSLPFLISPPSNALGFLNLNPNGLVNNPHPPFYVRGLPFDSCFSGQVTIVKVSGPGSLLGSLTQTATGGSAWFSNVIFNQAGNYVIKAISSGMTDAPNMNITITPATPSIVEIKVPLKMNGNLSASNNLFNAFLVELKSLIPNTTYRYINSVVNSSDGTSSFGAGNTIFVDAANGTFTRSTAPSLSSSYGTFTTDNIGTYRGWFMIEPTSDARFTPGDLVKYRIILNNGASGSFPNHFLTTQQQIKVLGWSDPVATNRGSFFEVSSPGLQPKNFLLVYNGDTLGIAGRPEFINVIESDGISLTSNTAILPAYRTLVDGQNTHSGIMLPNDLPLGITLIEERSLTGTLLNSMLPGDIRGTSYSANGIWPPGITTVNPSNGMTALSIQPVFSLVSIQSTEIEAESYVLNQNYPNPFNPVTNISFNLPVGGFTTLKVYDIMGRVVSRLINGYLNAGSHSVTFKGDNFASGIYYYSLESSGNVAVKKMLLVK